MSSIANDTCLPKDYPTRHGSSAFWEEFGRTVATFCHLEDILVVAHCMLATNRRLDPDENEKLALSQLEKDLKESLTDVFSERASKFIRALNNACHDDDIPAGIINNIGTNLKECIKWRNIFCHGMWYNFEDDGSSANIRHFKKRPKDDPELPQSLEDRLTLEDISSIRTETVYLEIDIIKVLRTAGIELPTPHHQKTSEAETSQKGIKK